MRQLNFISPGTLEWSDVAEPRIECDGPNAFSPDVDLDSENRLIHVCALSSKRPAAGSLWSSPFAGG